MHVLTGEGLGASLFDISMDGWMDGGHTFEGSLQITTLALMKVVETNSF